MELFIFLACDKKSKVPDTQWHGQNATCPGRLKPSSYYRHKNAMPQTCTVCRHEERAQIDTALIENEPLRNIAERFGLTPTSLHRHKQHLSTELIMAKQAYEVAQATTLLDHLQSLISRLDRLAHKAEEDRAWPAAIGALREIRGCLTLLAQLTGELEASRHTNVHLSVAFERVQMTLLGAN